jgi:hypothetical protein
MRVSATACGETTRAGETVSNRPQEATMTTATGTGTREDPLLQAMLIGHGDWIALGGADEQKAPADGTVEAWARSDSNPVGGFYGLKRGLRGRFGVYVPPLMEALGLAELEHNPRNNCMRALTM